MITQDWAFMVLGDPVQQGDMKCYGGNGGHKLSHSNHTDLKPWRELVRAAAVKWVKERADIHQPLDVTITWSLERPAGHWGTGRNKDTLKPSAPLWPATDLDVDKLARAVLDALTVPRKQPDVDALYANDSVVCDLYARKRYASMRGQTQLPPGVGLGLEDVLPCPGVVVRIYPKRAPDAQQ